MKFFTDSGVTTANTSSFHYPGWHEDAVAWLASHRSIHIIGVDSPSLDYGQSTTFPVHVLSSKKNISDKSHLILC